MTKKSISKPRKIIQLLVSVSVIGIFMLWGYMALNFPWFQAEEQPLKGKFAFSAVPSQPESEIIAAVSLRAGVLWIDEFIRYDGIGVAFGPFHKYAILEPGNFPDWHLVDSGTWNGQRDDFNFLKYSSQISTGKP